MDNTKIDFDKRKNEINEYFKFLEILNYENVSLKYTIINLIKEVQLSPELQRILIANTFLLLYNLIESTVRNSIMEIYSKIQDEGLTYQELSEKIKQIWLQKKIKNLNSSILEAIITSVIDNEVITLTTDDINISGNIDAQEIRKLANTIGFDISSDGRDLINIKDKRNRLAHGEQTFHDIGKDFTYSELNNFKKNTFKYLEDVIGKIEDYINTKKYKIS